MHYELYEALDNVGDLVKALAKAFRPDSDGGTKITLSEIISIVTEVGAKIVNDISDDDIEDTVKE